MMKWKATRHINQRFWR